MTHKQHKSKKHEEYEPETFAFVWVCPKCGWTKPATLDARTCGRCGAQLIRITRRVERVQAPKQAFRHHP